MGRGAAWSRALANVLRVCFGGPTRQRRVFVSYRRELDASGRLSPEHQDLVWRFAELLAEEFPDCDVIVDQRYQRTPGSESPLQVPSDCVNGRPIEGWGRWSRRQVDEADLVVCFVTPGYSDALYGSLDSNTGRGVHLEAMALIQSLWERSGDNGKILVVNASDGRHVPEFLSLSPRFSWPEEARRFLSVARDVLRGEPPAATAGPRKCNTYLRNPLFAGSDEVLELMAAPLASRSGSLKWIGLRGHSSVGKSVLLREYAHRHQAEYDIIWWCRGYSTEVLQRDLADLAQQHSIRAGQSFGVEALRRDAAVSWLEGHGRWLLLVDGVTDPAKLTGSLPMSGDHSAIIVTTRSSTGFPEQIHWIDVPPPSTANVTAVFQRYANSAETPSPSLLSEMGEDLPSVAMMGTLALDRQMDCARLGEELELARQSRPARNGVPSALLLTTSELQGRYSFLQEFLQICCVVEPVGIPAWLFTAAWWSGRWRRSPLSVDSVELLSLLRELRALSLAEFRGLPANVQIDLTGGFHEQLPLLLQETCGVSNTQSLELLLKVLAGVIPTGAMPGKRLFLLDDLMPHLRPAVQGGVGQLLQLSPRVQKFIVAVLDHLAVRAQKHKQDRLAIAYFRCAIEIAERTPEADKREQESRKHNLALCSMPGRRCPVIKD